LRSSGALPIKFAVHLRPRCPILREQKGGELLLGEYFSIDGFDFKEPFLCDSDDKISAASM